MTLGTSYAKFEFKTVHEMERFFNERAGLVPDVSKKIGKQRPGLNGLGASDADKFQAMLESDRIIYLKIVELRAYFQAVSDKGLADYPGDKTKRDKFYMEKGLYQYNGLYVRYQERQAEYRKYLNTKEAADEKVRDAKNWWDKFVDYIGLGIAPLVLPLAVVGAGLLTAGWVSYLIYKYYEKGQLDRNSALELAADIYAENPEMAKKILENIYNSEQSIFQLIGSGLKWFLILGAGAGTAYAGYRVAKHEGWV